MDFANVERIIDFVTTNKFMSLNVDLTADNAYYRRSPKVNIFTSCSYTDHACKHTITQLMNIKLISYLSLLYFGFVHKLILILIHQGN